MLRSLYRGLLDLHPSAFRKRFAEEMLSIFDHRTGWAAAFRLLMDAFISLARQWALRPEFWHDLSQVEQPASDGVPSFCTLDPFRPRTAAVIHGMVLSVTIFCATCYGIRYSWIRVLHIHIPEVAFESSSSTQPSASTPAMPEEPGSRSGGKSRGQDDTLTPFRFPSTSVNKVPNPPPVSPAQNGAATARPVPPGRAGSAPVQAIPAAIAAQKSAVQFFATANSKPGEGSETPAEPQSQVAPRPAPAAVVKNFSIDAAERRRVIDGAVADLTKYYVDPGIAQHMADALRAHEKNGDDDAATDGATFADLITRQMQDVSRDKYVMMVYSTVDTPENPPAATPDDVARYRREMEQNNCTFEKVETLPHNIGYLKFNAFPDAAICGIRAAAAMARLNDADAIIFDLRDNPGGYSNMVALLATYLFDRPTLLNDFYNRVDNSTEQSWTLSPVPGNKLADKPAFVLTSHTTFSAAEGFSYDLKMLKRATLVGETTSGRGHMGMAYRIDDRFTIRVPSVRVINPISRTNWEGSGVEPDVEVKAADALAVAVKLAEQEMRKK